MQKLIQYVTKLTYVFPQTYARESPEYLFNIRAVNRKHCQSSMWKPAEITHTRSPDQLNRVQVRTFRWTAPPSYTFLREEPLNVATSIFGVIVRLFAVAPLNGCLCLYYFSFLGALCFLKHFLRWHLSCIDDSSVKISTSISRRTNVGHFVSTRISADYGIRGYVLTKHFISAKFLQIPVSLHHGSRRKNISYFCHALY